MDMLTKITKQQVADIMEILENVFDNSTKETTGLYRIEEFFLWMSEEQFQSLQEMLEEYKQN